MHRASGRILLLSLSLLLLMLAAPATAQDTPQLDQRIATDDGVLSLNVPTGWSSLDDSDDPRIEFYSQLLIFGETELAVNSRVEYLRTEVGIVSGVGGYIGLVDPVAFAEQYNRTLDTFNVISVLAEESEKAGGDIGDITSSMTAGYSTHFVVTNNVPVNNQVALAIAADTEIGIVVIWSSSPPTDDQLVIDTVVAIPGTLSITPAASLMVADAEQFVSLSLPEGWVAGYYNGRLTFGENVNVVRGLSVSVSTISGNNATAGYILVDSFEDTYGPGTSFVPYSTLAFLLDGYGRVRQSEEGSVIAGSTELQRSDGNPAGYTLISYADGASGLFGAIADNTNQRLVLVELLAPTPAVFQLQRPLLIEIFGSIRVPAQPRAEVISLPVTEQETTISTTDDNPTNGTQTTEPPVVSTPEVLNDSSGQAIFRSNDGTVSIRLPYSWILSDQLALGNRLVIGENLGAVRSRQNEAFSLIDHEVGVAGTAITIEVLPIDTFTTEDVVPTDLAMQIVNDITAEWEANGGLIVFPAALLQGEAGTQVVRTGGVHGPTEVSGFVAVVVSPETNAVVLIETSSASSQELTQNLDLLEDAIRSIRVPAE